MGRRDKGFGREANADTPEDARRARELGAEGIGLCRTEHMFMQGERLKIMREMILSEGDEALVGPMQSSNPAARGLRGHLPGYGWFAGHRPLAGPAVARVSPRL